MKTIEIIHSTRRLGEKGQVVERKDKAADKWIDLGYAVEVKAGSKPKAVTKSSGDENQDPES